MEFGDERVRQEGLVGSIDRWRDLLPLPLLEPDEKTLDDKPCNKFQGVSRYRRQLRRFENMTMANEIIVALNEMGGHKHAKAGSPTVAQHESQKFILSQVVSLHRANECISTREAIRELLQFSPVSPYDEEAGSGTTVRPYERNLVSLPEVGAEIFDAADLADDVGRRMIQSWQSTMLREESEIHQMGGPKIYMDEVLEKSEERYHTFIKDLHDRNMLDFLDVAESLVTPFFVIKKNKRLRMVLDCRASNVLFKEPPDIAMPAGYSFSQIQVGQDDTVFTAQSDIKDYFYSIGLPHELRKYFCLPQVDLRTVAPDHPRCVGTLGPVLIYPAMRVIPMGWNWAMFIAQRVHQHQAMLAAEVSMENILVDGRPAPKLTQNGPPILVPYADNLNVIGTNRNIVQQTKDKIIKHLHGIGFRTHEEQDAVPQAESLGFVINGESGEVYPKPNKREKVRKILLWLAAGPKVSGRMIEKVIGHCIHFFMVRRELLAIFRAVYDFKSAHYEQRVKLWPSAAQECRWAAALLLMCRANLRLPWHKSVTASDASLTGTGVVEAVFDSELVAQVGSQKELWRYKASDSAGRAREHVARLDPFSDPGSVVEQKQESPWDDFQLNLEFQEVPTEMLSKDKWHVLFSSRMKKPEHITLLEGRAVVQTARHKARALHNFHHRHLHLGDNLGMTLCLDRGRAKNKPLLYQCRRMTAYSLACNIEYHHRWIPSEFNSADGASRIYEKNLPAEQPR